jgi:hypothetical protein
MNARNSRTGVAGGVFYVVSKYPLLGGGCVFCAVVLPETIYEKTVIMRLTVSRNVTLALTLADRYYITK